MTVLRVATANLLHGLSLSTNDADEAGLRAAVEVLTGPAPLDLVALQEVDRGQDRSHGVDQTAMVAEGVGACAWRFVPVLEGTPDPGRSWRPASADDGSELDGPSYGVGLVSRHPVRSWHVLRFAAPRVGAPLLVQGAPRARLMHVPDQPRAAVAAVVDGPGGTFTAVATHLSFVPGVNVRQLRAVARWAAVLPAPRLLLGDLNLPGQLPGRVVRRAPGGWVQLARAATYPSYGPRVQFDHVLGSGVERSAVRHVDVVRLPVSDHCALVVELDLPAG